MQRNKIIGRTFQVINCSVLFSSDKPGLVPTMDDLWLHHRNVFILCVFVLQFFGGRGRGGKALTGTKEDHPLGKSLFSHVCTKVSGSSFRVH